MTHLGDLVLGKLLKTCLDNLEEQVNQTQNTPIRDGYGCPQRRRNWDKSHYVIPKYMFQICIRTLHIFGYNKEIQ